METFHPFPRLSLELRIQIWKLATDDRVLRVRKTWRRKQGYWSPTPAPAVTRACWESRQHCNYQKAFIIDSSPRYIWANFDRDVIKMRSGLLSEGKLPECDEVRRLWIELLSEQGWDESQGFCDYGIYKLEDFPKLERFNLLVDNGLGQWTNFIDRTNWGACPRGNVRIVDGNTGEWIDEETSTAYQYYLDVARKYLYDVGRHCNHLTGHCTTGVQAIEPHQISLPRIDLDY